MPCSYQAIYNDLDGTLTGHGPGWVHGFFPGDKAGDQLGYFPRNKCGTDPKLGNGMYCDSSLTLRTYRMVDVKGCFAGKRALVTTTHGAGDAQHFWCVRYLETAVTSGIFYSQCACVDIVPDVQICLLQ